MLVAGQTMLVLGCAPAVSINPAARDRRIVLAVWVAGGGAR
jgi:hypothetical protein